MLYEFDPYILSLNVKQYEKTSQEEKKPPLLEETTHGFKLCRLPQREKKWTKVLKKYHKWAFLKHQAYLGFNGPSMQINIELNTFWSDLPFWQVLVMGTSQEAAAKLGLSP